MTTLKQINQAISKQWPDLGIEMVRGAGYFYFDGNDGFDKLESIYVPCANAAPLSWWIDAIATRIEDAATE